MALKDYCEDLLRSGNPNTSGLIKEKSSSQQNLTPMYRYEPDGLKALFDEKLKFSVSLGGFDTEPYEANPVHPSPQVRQISPSTTLKVPVIVVERQYILRLESFKIQHYSAQGKQDLQISLAIGNRQVFISGLKKSLTLDSSSPVEIARETRIISNTGMPFTSLGITGGVGFPDNFPRKKTRTFAIAYEGDAVSWQIINQSDLYTHAIKLEIYGWIFPMQGRTKEENLKHLAK